MSDIKVFSKNNGVAIVTPTARTWFGDPDGDFVAEAAAISNQVNIKRDVDSFYIYKNFDYTKIKDADGVQIGSSRDNCVSLLNSDYFDRTSKIQEIDNVDFQNQQAKGQLLKLVDVGGGSLRFSNELLDIVDDTTPQLGGNLDVQGFNLFTSATDQDIMFTPSGTGSINLDGTVKFKRFTSAPTAFEGGMYADNSDNLYFGVS